LIVVNLGSGFDRCHLSGARRFLERRAMLSPVLAASELAEGPLSIGPLGVRWSISIASRASRSHLEHPRHHARSVQPQGVEPGMKSVELLGGW